MAFCLIFSSICIACSVGKSKKESIASVSPLRSLTCVIDAGHGGIDVGAVGKNGTLESNLNLEYAKTLKNMMQEYGISVVMTRENEDGLYTEFKNGFKMQDMRKRREIIQDTNPDFVISIHMNKYSASSSKGAQVFYDDVYQSGKKLAETLQKIFIAHLPSARKETKCADLYMLKCTPAPSILVECGFLSNPDEEELLTQKTYREKVCYCILSAVIAVI